MGNPEQPNIPSSNTSSTSTPSVNTPSSNPSDHLANERTFLAWIRTSLAIMAFGFVVVRFSLFVRQLSLVLSDKTVLPGKGDSRIVGIVLVGIGGLLAIFSWLRYRLTEKQLLKKEYRPSGLLSAFLTLTILIICGLLLVYLLSTGHGA